MVGLTTAVAGAVALTSHTGGDTGELIWLLPAGFLLGLYLVYDGYDKWQTKRLVEDTPTEKVRSAAVGRTELEGTAKPVDGTIEAPLTDDDCLYVSWRVEEHRGSGDDSDWVTLASDDLSVPFLLDDGTGQMLVEAHGGDPEFEISDENRTETHVGGSDDAPAKVQQFISDGPPRNPVAPRDGTSDTDDGFVDKLNDAVTIEPSHGNFDIDGPSIGGTRGGAAGISDGFAAGASGGSAGLGFSNNSRRYYQQVLPASSDVYVLGSAEPRAWGQGTEGDLLKMTRDPSLDEFLISDLSEAQLESHYERWGPIEIVGGIVLSAGCLAGMLWILGLA
jgi:hypothetical protein